MGDTALSPYPDRTSYTSLLACNATTDRVGHTSPQSSWGCQEKKKWAAQCIIHLVSLGGESQSRARTWTAGFIKRAGPTLDGKIIPLLPAPAPTRLPHDHITASSLITNLYPLSVTTPSNFPVLHSRRNIVEHIVAEAKAAEIQSMPLNSKMRI